jgi:predicted transcriptional regulator
MSNSSKGMDLPKLTKFELQIMETIWTRGASPIRHVQEGFPENVRPAYTTVQTIMYRLEKKKVVRRISKIGNAHIFEAAVSRNAVHRKLIDEFLALFDSRTQPVMAGLIESGKFTMESLSEAEKATNQKLTRQNGKSR